MCHPLKFCETCPLSSAPHTHHVRTTEQQAAAHRQPQSPGEGTRRYLVFDTNHLNLLAPSNMWCQTVFSAKQWSSWKAFFWTNYIVVRIDVPTYTCECCSATRGRHLMMFGCMDCTIYLSCCVVTVTIVPNSSNWKCRMSRMAIECRMNTRQKQFSNMSSSSSRYVYDRTKRAHGRRLHFTCSMFKETTHTNTLTCICSFVIRCRLIPILD